MEREMRPGKKKKTDLLSEKGGSADVSRAYGEQVFEALDAAGLFLLQTDEGLTLTDGKQALTGDFSSMLRRAGKNQLSQEMIVRASRLKKAEGEVTVLDATAGLGEDSFLLAAAGFRVLLFEKDPVIALLLSDAIGRAKKDESTAHIAGRMELIPGDSISGMAGLTFTPEVIYLDPMFPERQKSALIKKKFQLLQKLEMPCDDEEKLLAAAEAVRPKKIVIKRPLKGPYLAGKKPDYSLEGKAIRYDCLVFA